MLDQSVLVLNRYWIAVHICTVKRALSLVCAELARVVTEDYQTYDFDSWRELSAFADRARPLIHTPQFALLLPQVIVLSRYHRVPPRTVRFNRRNIFLRDHHRCQYCGCRGSEGELTIDHIIPRSRGGLSTWQNVVVACTPCNTRKSNRLPAECGMHPMKAPAEPSWASTLARLPMDDVNRPVWQQFIDTAYWETNLQE